VRETSLRYFRDEEIAGLGGASAFIPLLWERARLSWGRQERVWAIPWWADIRLVFYWRDMLEQAGVDGETAFETPERVAETMERLQVSGIEAPWGVWGEETYLVLQNASTWIWAAGGDIVSADGKQILLDKPEAMDALLQYFSLARYMHPEIDQLQPGNYIALQAFSSRRAAVMMAPSFMRSVVLANAGQEASDLLSVVAPPGPSFVGGAYLVIWRHARAVEESLALIRFLTGKHMQLEQAVSLGFLPVRQDILEDPTYLASSGGQIMVNVLKNGRAYPSFYNRRNVDETLDQALTWLWNSLLADRDQDVEAVVKPYIEATARRLAVVLGLRR
jgi:ABC-type glycerol-3-phosphate transport system substrate-binding protein